MKKATLESTIPQTEPENPAPFSPDRDVDADVDHVQQEEQAHYGIFSHARRLMALVRTYDRQRKHKPPNGGAEHNSESDMDESSSVTDSPTRINQAKSAAHNIKQTFNEFIRPVSKRSRTKRRSRRFCGISLPRSFLASSYSSFFESYIRYDILISFYSVIFAVIIMGISYLGCIQNGVNHQGDPSIRLVHAGAAVFYLLFCVLVGTMRPITNRKFRGSNFSEVASFECALTCAGILFVTSALVAGIGYPLVHPGNLSAAQVYHPERFRLRFPTPSPLKWTTLAILNARLLYILVKRLHNQRPSINFKIKGAYRRTISLLLPCGIGLSLLPLCDSNNVAYLCVFAISSILGILGLRMMLLLLYSFALEMEAERSTRLEWIAYYLILYFMFLAIVSFIPFFLNGQAGGIVSIITSFMMDSTGYMIPCLLQWAFFSEHRYDELEKYGNMTRFVRWLGHEVRVPANNCFLCLQESQDVIQTLLQQSPKRREKLPLENLIKNPTHQVVSKAISGGAENTASCSSSTRSSILPQPQTIESWLAPNVFLNNTSNVGNILCQVSHTPNTLSTSAFEDASVLTTTWSSMSGNQSSRTQGSKWPITGINISEHLPRPPSTAGIPNIGQSDKRSPILNFTLSGSPQSITPPLSNFRSNMKDRISSSFLSAVTPPPGPMSSLSKNTTAIQRNEPMPLEKDSLSVGREELTDLGLLLGSACQSIGQMREVLDEAIDLARMHSSDYKLTHSSFDIVALFHETMQSFVASFAAKKCHFEFCAAIIHPETAFESIVMLGRSKMADWDEVTESEMLSESPHASHVNLMTPTTPTPMQPTVPTINSDAKSAVCQLGPQTCPIVSGEQNLTTLHEQNETTSTLSIDERSVAKGSTGLRVSSSCDDSASGSFCRLHNAHADFEVCTRCNEKRKYMYGPRNNTSKHASWCRTNSGHSGSIGQESAARSADMSYSEETLKQLPTVRTLLSYDSRATFADSPNRSVDTPSGTGRLVSSTRHIRRQTSAGGITSRTARRLSGLNNRSQNFPTSASSECGLVDPTMRDNCSTNIDTSYDRPGGYSTTLTRCSCKSANPRLFSGSDEPNSSTTYDQPDVATGAHTIAVPSYPCNDTVNEHAVVSTENASPDHRSCHAAYLPPIESSLGVPCAISTQRSPYADNVPVHSVRGIQSSLSMPHTENIAVVNSKHIGTSSPLAGSVISAPVRVTRSKDPAHVSLNVFAQSTTSLPSLQSTLPVSISKQISACTQTRSSKGSLSDCFQQHTNTTHPLDIPLSQIDENTAHTKQVDAAMQNHQIRTTSADMSSASHRTLNNVASTDADGLPSNLPRTTTVLQAARAEQEAAQVRAEESVWVSGARERLAQVMRNFASNALKYGGNKVRAIMLIRPLFTKSKDLNVNAFVSTSSLVQNPMAGRSSPLQNAAHEWSQGENSSSNTGFIIQPGAMASTEFSGKARELHAAAGDRFADLPAAPTTHTRHMLQAHAYEITFLVQDAGIGFNVEQASRLFKPFSQLRSGQQGSGLGLSLCKATVRRHGGHIYAFSAGENKGSTFWFTVRLQTTRAPFTNPQLQRHATLEAGSLRSRLFPRNDGVLSDEQRHTEHFHTNSGTVENKMDLHRSHSLQVPNETIRRSTSHNRAQLLEGKRDSRTPSQSTRNYLSSMNEKSVECRPVTHATENSCQRKSTILMATSASISPPEGALFDGCKTNTTGEILHSVAVTPSLTTPINPGTEHVQRSLHSTQSAPTTRRVLVVDDVPLTTRLMARILRRAPGVELVDTAANGKEALATISEKGTNFYSHVFTDGQMPEMDGYELTRYLSKEMDFVEKGGIIIGVTGNSLADDVDNFIRSGAVTVITKPVDRQRLVTALSLTAADLS